MADVCSRATWGCRLHAPGAAGQELQGTPSHGGPRPVRVGDSRVPPAVHGPPSFRWALSGQGRHAHRTGHRGGPVRLFTERRAHADDAAALCAASAGRLQKSPLFSSARFGCPRTDGREAGRRRMGTRARCPGAQPDPLREVRGAHVSRILVRVPLVPDRAHGGPDLFIALTAGAKPGGKFDLDKIWAAISAVHLPTPPAIAGAVATNGSPLTRRQLVWADATAAIAIVALMLLIAGVWIPYVGVVAAGARNLAGGPQLVAVFAGEAAQAERASQRSRRRRPPRRRHKLRGRRVEARLRGAAGTARARQKISCGCRASPSRRAKH